MTEIDITGKTLTIEEVNAVAYNRATVKPLGQETKARMTTTQAVAEACDSKTGYRILRHQHRFRLPRQ